MFPYCRRHLAAVTLTLLLFCPLPGGANEVKTKHGGTCRDVPILGRDEDSFKFSGAHGTLKRPLAVAERIDGLTLAAASPLPSAPGAPLPPSAAAGVPAGSAGPGTPLASTPAPTIKPPVVPPVGEPVNLPPDAPTAGAASRTAASPAVAATTAATTAANPADQGVVAQPQNDVDWVLYWSLVALIALAVLWLITLPLVWLDLRRRHAASYRWLYLAGLLPVLGSVLYLILGRKPPAAADDAPERDPTQDFHFLDENNELISIKPGVDRSGIRNAKDILNDALIDRASDVHIEPTAQEYGIRFRVDGTLYPRMKFTPEEGLRLVSALKSLAQLDIAERRQAQDGRFGGRRGPREVDFRLATTPSISGEKLVIRILDSKTGLRGLNELGMTEQMMAQFTQVIHSRNGMILATGPTGSGKTSTLYAALTQLDAVALNLMTIEDPVEYQLPGATQIPVNVKAGVTYESGLRSVLRQDPDVILVGEMRDREAAQIALRSALTGHLVFSSLHTNNALGTIMRLEEMGIDRPLLASALFVVVAQRLVRVVCPQCREAYACTGEELAGVGLELPAGSEIYRAKGCRRCDVTGYLGRTGVFEILIFDEELRQAVSDGAGESALYEIAYRKGYRNYREDAAVKVLMGITTVDEVLKAG